ncbi:Protein LURP-one-related 15 [Forsythia ovata]|uniref:Protein LURP-one-related 15 n=1 Tax=Forsythia ovata TaxID=205694 RepID=A0ABD1WGU8_9LAMI
MAEIPYDSNLAQSGPVIGPHFCVSHLVHLLIDKKAFTLRSTRYLVTSADGNLMFKVKKFPLSFHGTLVVLDTSGNPVITLRPKKLTYHSRWQVFRGESTDDKDLIFSVKKSSRFQSNTKLDVFLASNTSEENCDFKVEETHSDGSCDIFAGNSSTPIAQMDNKRTGSIFSRKDKLVVNVSPNVDYAMIVSLIIILDDFVSGSSPISTSIDFSRKLIDRFLKFFAAVAHLHDGHARSPPVVELRLSLE